MIKIRKGLILHVDKNFQKEPKTGERYKIAVVKVIDCDSETLSNEKVFVYINRHTNPSLLISLVAGDYLYNFEVEKHNDGYIVSNDLPDDFESSRDNVAPLENNYEDALAYWAKNLGSEYSEALGKALLIRMDRKDQYGDKYLDDTYEELVTQVNDKMKRVKLNAMHQGEHQYETALDAALDAVNYSIFAAAKIINSKKDGNEEQ